MSSESRYLVFKVGQLSPGKTRKKEGSQPKKKGFQYVLHLQGSKKLDVFKEEKEGHCG